MRKVAVLVGSLRRQSVNKALARTISHMALAKLDCRFLEVGDLPLYNDDLWAAPPSSVLRLKAEIAACDAALLVTPEYNRAVAAPLKNAFDWASRPSKGGVWSGMPAATAGASSGFVGTAVAQSHLRHSLSVLGAVVMGQPELYVQLKPDGLTEEGAITDQALRARIAAWTESFITWVERYAA